MPLPKNATLDDISKLSQPNPTRGAIEARAVHMSLKMADLPNTYRNALPMTDDQDALRESEAVIRAQHAQDMALHAMSEVVNPPPLDVSKFWAKQKIELGLRMGKPGASQAAAAPQVAGSQVQQPVTQPKPWNARQLIEFAINGGQKPRELM